ncbi:MAG: hypothetical protein ABR968_00925 [Bacteroidales bacterium]|jgi:hypothetical protein
MTGTTTNIPRNIKAFNTFIVKTCAYLVLGSPQNYVRFGWSAANLAAWQAFLNQWNPLYLLYIDRKGGYTTDIKNDLINIIKAVIAYDLTNKVILKVKATSGLTSIDCSTFNLPESLSTPATGMHPVASVKAPDKTIGTENLVYPELTPIGGSEVKIKAYLNTKKSGRAHKPKGYDLLEYAVAVFYWGTGGTPTHATDSRLHLDHSTKANFKLDTSVFTSNLGTLATGTAEPLKLAVFFFRWAKSKHPTLDGPWSGPFTVQILQ